MQAGLLDLEAAYGPRRSSDDQVASHTVADGRRPVGFMLGTDAQSPRAFLIARLRLADIQARKP